MVIGETINSVFNPNDFASLGTLDVTLWYGAIQHRHTRYRWFCTVWRGGAVAKRFWSKWPFLHSIRSTSAPDVNFIVNGDRGLVLGSKGDLTFDGVLNLNGGAGTTSSGGTGAPGAEGGLADDFDFFGNFNSAPPAAKRRRRRSGGGQSMV